MRQLWYAVNTKLTDEIAMTDQINNMIVKNWMIITWRHIDHEDAPYGRLLQLVHDTRENAEIVAREFIPNYSPVGMVEEIV